LKICVVTSYAAAAEPRAPRHAVAAKRAFPGAEVVFVDLVAASQSRNIEPPIFEGVDIGRVSVVYPTRASSLPRLAARKLATRWQRAWFAATGQVREGVFGDRVLGLTRVLEGLAADVYIAHNIETLLPAIHAAGGRAHAVFDCMEYYSDMGDGQSALESRAARVLEAKCLRECALVIASSERLADTLAAEYGIRPPLASYNVAPTWAELPAKKGGGGLNLYWRNGTIGLGQRGLDDALCALRELPADVRLSVQGRPGADGGSAVRERARVLGVADRVAILPPYAPRDAVVAAAAHDVGLCLERRGPRNHDLTVSNKMFDYHMAGLAVVSSDLPSLRDVIERSRGGLLYAPGDASSLAKAIASLYSSPSLLNELQANARRFALEEANLEMELDRLAAALRAAVPTPRAPRVS
jgi:hypothetical protein